jgi:preprotein translocase subunit SecD
MANTFLVYFSLALLLCSCQNVEDARSNKKITSDTSYTAANGSDSILRTGWYYVIDSGNFKRQLDKSSEFYFIDPHPITTAKNIAELEIYSTDYGKSGLVMRLDKNGTETWSIATEKYIGKRLAFILDNKLMIAAKVNSQITSGATAINRAVYSDEEIENFKTIINKER